MVSFTEKLSAVRCTIPFPGRDNLTTDAHLAAMAIEHGAALYSTDNDFRRFSGLEHVNPLTAR